MEVHGGYATQPHWDTRCQPWTEGAHSLQGCRKEGRENRKTCFTVSQDHWSCSSCLNCFHLSDYWRYLIFAFHVGHWNTWSWWWWSWVSKGNIFSLFSLPFTQDREINENSLLPGEEQELWSRHQAFMLAVLLEHRPSYFHSQNCCLSLE